MRGMKYFTRSYLFTTKLNRVINRTSLVVVFVTCSAIAMIIVEFYYEFTIHYTGLDI